MAGTESAPGEDFGWWVEELSHRVGVDPAVVDVEAVLEMTGHAAHNVARPAAPVSAYIAGLATSSGASRAEAVALIGRVADLARAAGSEGSRR